jgi:hypothetical protein
MQQRMVDRTNLREEDREEANWLLANENKRLHLSKIT